MRQKIDEWLDWLHDNTCGDYTIWFNIARPFIVECPCCSWYRGLFMGAAAGSLITWVL